MSELGIARACWSSQDDEGTKSGFFDASTVGRQSIPADAPIESTSRLVPLPTPADDNIFDRRRSPTYINNRPNFRPPNMGPSLYPRTTNPTPSLQGPRPSFPTHRIPSGAPKPSMINTPVPTSEVTESFYPTDSSTYAGTMEYTTLPPSFSPAPSTWECQCTPCVAPIGVVKTAGWDGTLHTRPLKRPKRMIQQKKRTGRATIHDHQMVAKQRERASAWCTTLHGERGIGWRMYIFRVGKSRFSLLSCTFLAYHVAPIVQTIIWGKNDENDDAMLHFFQLTWRWREPYFIFNRSQKLMIWNAFEQDKFVLW